MIRSPLRIKPDSAKLTVKVKTKPCAVCTEPFVKQRMGQKVCGPMCAIQHAALVKAKKAAQELRAQKEAATPTKKLLKRAEDAVNRVVRARDYLDGCISCEKPSHWDGVWHASHFKSVGSNSVLRFNLLNIHKGCSQCNWARAGNIHGYRPRLEAKIGADRVEWLDCQKGISDYQPEYLIRLAKVMNKKARRLEKRNASHIGEGA
jgi:hypothetical protein